MASSLKKRVKALEISNKKRRDFDPEDDPFARAAENSDDDSSIEEDETNGREHYESVGKSKLRKPSKIQLDDKKYGGQVVSRTTLNGDGDDEHDPFAPVESDEDEDPFAARAEDVDGSEGSGGDDMLDIDGNEDDDDDDDDDEIDSDDAFEEGDEEKFKSKGFVFRGSGKEILPKTTNDEDGESEEDESSNQELGSSEASASESAGDSDGVSDVDMDDEDDEDADEDQDMASEESEDEDSLSAHPRPKSLLTQPSTDREKLRALITSDTTAIATSLSQAATADAKKGKAVKQQYQTFDRLLDARIKLQKGLTASNSITPQTNLSDEDVQVAIQKAEEAALRLYTTIESLRHNILDSNTSSATQNKKRKRPAPATIATPTSDLITRTTNLESESLPTRRATLDKWSTKLRATTPVSSSKLNTSDPTPHSNLTTILDTYLLSTPSTPSSLSPYDDTTYYQSLLRDLITSRSRNSASTSIPEQILPLKLHASGNTKRKDTKASKGRKVRYTVHEKLENFMAGTGNAGVGSGQWTDGAVREFFGSLMGGAGVLDEDEDEDGNRDGDEEGEEGQREVEALRLFRS